MRRLAVFRTVYGVFLLVASDAVVETVTGKQSRTAATIGRFIGARHVIQALTLSQMHSEGWRTVGVVTDVLHALSMVALAGLSERYRRLAVLAAASAGIWGVSGWLSHRRS